MSIYTLWLFPLLCALLLGKFIAQWPDGQLHYIQCDVGQGDAILLVLRSTQILVDGGPSEREILRCLETYLPFWDKELEVIVVTHADRDHIGGLDAVLGRYRVGQFFYSGADDRSNDWTELMSLAQRQSIPIITGTAGTKMTTEALSLQVLWPPSDDTYNRLIEESKDSSELLYQLLPISANDGENRNEESVVIWVRYGETSALLTGDITAMVESQVLALYPSLTVDLLKVAHHGSRFSSSKDFLEAIHPQIATIGVGMSNTYGHPSDTLISLLIEKDIDVYRTDKDHTIVLSSDGHTWSHP